MTPSVLASSFKEHTIQTFVLILINSWKISKIYLGHVHSPNSSQIHSPFPGYFFLFSVFLTRFETTQLFKPMFSTINTNILKLELLHVWGRPAVPISSLDGHRGNSENAYLSLGGLGSSSKYFWVFRLRTLGNTCFLEKCLSCGLGSSCDMMSSMSSRRTSQDAEGIFCTT